MTRSETKLPAFIVDVAIDIIVQELGVYLGMRTDVSRTDIEEGFDALAESVVGACYAAITRAEKRLALSGDLEAFEKELRAFARAAGRSWANARTAGTSTEWPELPTLDTLELTWVTSQAMRQARACPPTESDLWAERLLSCADDLTRRATAEIDAPLRTARSS